MMPDNLKTIRENKLISIMIGIVFTGLVGWGSWVTSQTFERGVKVQLNQKSIESVLQAQEKTLSIVCMDINELKGIDRELKKEDKELRELIHKNQKEIMNTLLSIKNKMTW